MLNHNQGHTLLELLIALSLGILIIAGGLSFYHGTQTTQKIQIALAIARENAKFAFDIMKADIQQAGFYGCITPMVNTHLINSLNDPQDDFKWNFLQAVSANEYISTNQWSPKLDNSLRNAKAYKGDVLTLRYANRREFAVKKHDSAIAAITITSGNGIKKNDYVLAADCVQGSIFQKTNTSTVSMQHLQSISSKYAGNRSNDLGYVFAHNATLRELHSISYFIAKKKQRIPALYRKDGARRSEEIISGITDIQIRFGIDSNSDGNIDSYLNAQQMNNQWQHIVLIDLSITANAYKDNIIQGDEVALYRDGSEIVYQLQASIALRNHLP
jgi:type IV pilus assembly protein PilW